MARGSQRRTNLWQRTTAIARAWLPVIAWMAVIFVASSRQDQHGGLSVGVIIPKLAHIVVFAVLGFLVARALRSDAEPALSQRSLLAIVIVGLYGISDELHQSLVPSREARLTDVLFDVIGGLIGIVAWTAAVELWRRLR